MAGAGSASAGRAVPGQRSRRRAAGRRRLALARPARRGSASAGHHGDEAKAEAMGGGDVARRCGVVAEGDAQLADAPATGAVGDDRSGPDRVEELVLGHQPPGRPHRRAATMALRVTATARRRAGVDARRYRPRTVRIAIAERGAMTTIEPQRPTTEAADRRLSRKSHEYLRSVSSLGGECGEHRPCIEELHEPLSPVPLPCSASLEV